MNNQVKYELHHISNLTFILPNELELKKNGAFYNPYNEEFLAYFSPYISYIGIPSLPDWRPDKFRQPRYFKLKPTHFICEFISEDNPNNKDLYYPEFRKAKTISGSFFDKIILVGKYVFETVLDKQEKKLYNEKNLSDASFRKIMEAQFNKSKK
jgi:hypothetical protein